MIKKIYLLNRGTTAMFAASELVRYLRLISKTPITFQIVPMQTPVRDGLNLGLFTDGFSKSQIKGQSPSEMDDSVLIDVKKGAGCIAGANERSILIGVYRFLHTLGCRWVRPGAEGEYIPRLALSQLNVSMKEKASYRHRVVCIEGAVSLENVVDIIDWAPKVGFSGYFMQFPDGHAFFYRWYSHTGNDHREREPFSKETARAFTIRIEEEIRKRSLQYHGVGHGWTCGAIGLDVSHWDPIDVPMPAESKSFLAQTGGKRAFQWDRPMITSLCFSQAEVRRRMVKVIAEYAVQHPEVDLLHVWIDDGMNQKCECPECQKYLPSETYVQMLHELDAALKKAKCATRLVFIAYADLLWPPQKKLKSLDPDRFVFVYANSRGDYEAAVKIDEKAEHVTPPFMRNKNSLKRTPGEFLGFLEGWQKQFKGDSMLFEYHLGTSLRAFNSIVLSRVIAEDIHNLKALGLNGYVSCQLQRIFFPVGLSMYVMGQTLWNSQVDIDAMTDDYFQAAFGPKGIACKEFLKVSAEKLNQAFSFKSGIVASPRAEFHLARLEHLVAEFSNIVEANVQLENPCWARSWYYMGWYLRILSKLILVFRAILTQRPTAVLEEWKKTREFIVDNEHCYQSVFDVHSYVMIMDRYIVDGSFSSAPEAVVQ